MPPAKSIRQRAVDKENESGTVRLTRAKAAALAGPDDLSGEGLTKKPLQSKKSASNLVTNPAPAGRKRAALGDVSNVTKVEAIIGKDGKKTLSGKAGLVSKATQNAGIQKVSRANSTRSILGSKDNNSKKASIADLKRPASGSGVMGGAVKKRQAGSTGSRQSTKETTPASENEPPTKKVYVEVEKRVNATTVEDDQDQQDGIKLEEEEEGTTKPTIPQGVLDLEADDYDDPVMVAEYATEIFDYLKVLEEATMPNPNYMDHQDHLTWSLRDILVDWMVEVHTRFHLLPETLYLAVNILDRFLSAKVVQLDRLQLVGVTALFIAAKYEEVMSPHVENFRNVADDGFTVAEILSAERYVLAALNYDLSYPNPMNFLRRVSKGDMFDIQTRTLAKYLLEIGCMDYRFIEYSPSLVAAASMNLARRVLGKNEWHPTIAYYAGYLEHEVQPCVKLLIDYLRQPVIHNAFFNKYASKKFLKASIHMREWAKKYYALNHANAPPAKDGTKSISGTSTKSDSSGRTLDSKIR